MFDTVAMRAVEKMESAIPLAFKRAKRYLVLLTTEKSMSAAAGLKDLKWFDPIPLPNSSQMILAIGQRPAENLGSRCSTWNISIGRLKPIYGPMHGRSAREQKSQAESEFATKKPGE